MNLRRFFLTCAIALALASAAHAKPVTIRSGDHEDFTRLVLTIPVGSTFSLRNTEGGHALSLNPPPTGYDLSGVFSRITRDRISALHVTDGSLLIDTATCNCTATAFLWRSNKLVIDIEGRIQPEIRPQNRPTKLPDYQRVVAPAFTPKPAATIRLSAFEKAIESSVRSFAAADHSATIRPTDDHDLKDLGDEISALNGGVGVTAHALIEDAFSPLPTAGPPEELCAGMSRLAPWEWSDGRTFSAQYSDLLGTYFTAESEADFARNLARLYLSHGFGLEARATLKALNEPTPKDSVLMALAAVLDALPSNPSETIPPGICGPGFDFWNRLSNGNAEGLDKAGAMELFKYSQRVPSAMTDRVAPAFTALMDAAGASDVLSILASRHVAAENDNARIEADPVPAYLELIEVANSSGTALSDDMLVSAESIAFEYASDETEGLLIGVFKNRLMTQQYDRAYTLLTKIEDSSTDLSDTFFNSLAQDADEGQFLHLFLRHNQHQLSTATLEAIETRLASLGFAPDHFEPQQPEEIATAVTQEEPDAAKSDQTEFLNEIQAGKIALSQTDLLRERAASLLAIED